jgi:hypothetical protein
MRCVFGGSVISYRYFGCVVLSGLIFPLRRMQLTILTVARFRN